METVPLAIPEVILVKPRRFGDDRGWFEETWQVRRYADAGIDATFVQDNQSMSVMPGTVRGLHFQAPPHAQAKLVRVARGAVVDVAVDIRKGSPTYGQWVAAELSEENGHQLFVPRGFAHGFCTRAPNTAVCYKVDGFYDRQSEGGIRFDDPDLAIDWGIDPEEAVLSDKDRVLPLLRELDDVFP
jgi:dTDP-4-dehydrorhamnose 3,5-epimerase